MRPLSDDPGNRLLRVRVCEYLSDGPCNIKFSALTTDEEQSYRTQKEFWNCRLSTLKIGSMYPILGVKRQGENYETLGANSLRVLFRTFGSDVNIEAIRYYRTLDKGLVMDHETWFWLRVIGWTIAITIGLW